MHEQSEIALYCPYCGSAISVLVDSSVPDQTYIEDCEVCCRPMVLTCIVDGDDVVVEARRGDD